MKYNLYFYDGSKNAVVMTDMEGKELVEECDRTEANVVHRWRYKEKFLELLNR